MTSQFQPKETTRATTIGPARRSARALIAPYLRPISQWNMDLALLRQLAVSRHLTAVERDAVRHQLLDLQKHVVGSRRSFAAAVARHPSHDIIVDLDNSYRRLASQLESTIASVGLD